MKYVKLIAKPDTWFKEGTEAYRYGSTQENPQRLTLDEWEEMLKDGMYCLNGIRIAQRGYGAVENCGHIEGKEYWDGECGSTDEFEVEIIEV